MSETALGSGPDEEWETLLRQLRDQPPARPQPYFYARLSARLNAAAQPRRVPAWLLRPAYAVLLGVMVFALSGDGRALPHAAALSTEPVPRLGR